ncbi:MAG: hypothetical protein N2689_18185, partial [Verrucomicrobiae bacterium]|nr:hypothetical protein [Verrucomicrobiae bacterium]
SYAALRLRILALGQTLTARCGPALAAGHHGTLQPLAMETVAQPDMISVVIFDAQGLPVASAGRVDPATRVHVGRALIARFQQSNAASYETHPDPAGDQFVYLPVRERAAPGAPTRPGRLLGAIELGVSHVPTILMLQEAWMMSLLYTLLVGLVVALACARLVGRIVRPLAQQYEATLESRQREKMMAVGQLGAGIAHEINNPLTAILGYAQLMLHDMQLDPLVRKRVEIIEREALRCGEIVQTLLAYSRPAAQTTEITDLRPIIERAVEQVRPRAASQKVEIHCRFDDALPPLRLNSGEMQQVAVNILTNA